MRATEGRLGSFLNEHLHPLWMILKYGTTNLNTAAHWNARISRNYREPEKIEKVVREMNNMITQGASVLDVGMGSGAFLKMLRESKTTDVFGIDASALAVQRLKDCSIEACCCELPARPSTGRTFDFITMRDLLEHLKYPWESLSVLADMLNPNGKLLVSVPNNMLGPEIEPGHFRKYDRTALIEELSACFTVLGVKVIDDRLFAVCLNKQSGKIM